MASLMGDFTLAWISLRDEVLTCDLSWVYFVQVGSAELCKGGRDGVRVNVILSTTVDDTRVLLLITCLSLPYVLFSTTATYCS